MNQRRCPDVFQRMGHEQSFFVSISEKEKRYLNSMSISFSFFFCVYTDFSETASPTGLIPVTLCKAYFPVDLVTKFLDLFIVNYFFSKI